MAALSGEQVLAVVRSACVRVLEVDPADVVLTSCFTGDLGADSLALVEVVEAVEQALSRLVAGIRIEDGDIDGLRTAGDLVEHLVARS